MRRYLRFLGCVYPSTDVKNHPSDKRRLDPTHFHGDGVREMDLTGLPLTWEHALNMPVGKILGTFTLPCGSKFIHGEIDCNHRAGTMTADSMLSGKRLELSLSHHFKQDERINSDGLIELIQTRTPIAVGIVKGGLRDSCTISPATFSWRFDNDNDADADADDVAAANVVVVADSDVTDDNVAVGNVPDDNYLADTDGADDNVADGNNDVVATDGAHDEPKQQDETTLQTPTSDTSKANDMPETGTPASVPATAPATATTPVSTPAAASSTAETTPAAAAAAATATSASAPDATPAAAPAADPVGEKNVPQDVLKEIADAENFRKKEGWDAERYAALTSVLAQGQLKLEDALMQKDTELQTLKAEKEDLQRRLSTSEQTNDKLASATDQQLQAATAQLFDIFRGMGIEGFQTSEDQEAFVQSYAHNNPEMVPATARSMQKLVHASTVMSLRNAEQQRQIRDQQERAADHNTYVKAVQERLSERLSGAGPAASPAARFAQQNTFQSDTNSAAGSRQGTKRPRAGDFTTAAADDQSAQGSAPLARPYGDFQSADDWYNIALGL